VLAGLGLALVVLGLVVADRLARTIVAPIADLSAVSHRLARAELTARASPAGPLEVREVGTALNHLAGRIQRCAGARRAAARPDWGWTSPAGRPRPVAARCTSGRRPAAVPAYASSWPR
jgi:hypothetical protein